jgi:hypothetical protein
VLPDLEENAVGIREAKTVQPIGVEGMETKRPKLESVVNLLNS